MHLNGVLNYDLYSAVKNELRFQLRFIEYGRNQAEFWNAIYDVRAQLDWVYTA